MTTIYALAEAWSGGGGGTHQTLPVSFVLRFDNGALTDTFQFTPSVTSGEEALSGALGGTWYMGGVGF